jgi:hypothetical protein
MSIQNPPRIPLPKSWNKHVRSSLLHVISLAQFAVAYTRGWAANSINPRLREKSELERLIGIVALLREKIRIKDAVCTPAAVAFLLVVCGGARSFLTPDHEDRDLRQSA